MEEYGCGIKMPRTGMGVRDGRIGKWDRVKENSNIGDRDGRIGMWDMNGKKRNGGERWEE